jgi:hypothetical protein
VAHGLTCFQIRREGKGGQHFGHSDRAMRRRGELGC